MNKQVITITPAGAVSGLQVKKGKGFDLKSLGHANIERVSEILWHERTQRWIIKLLDPAPMMYRGRLSLQVLEHAGFPLPDTATTAEVGIFDDIKRTLVLFEDYDDAVATEIAFLNSLRVRGIF